MRELLPTDSTAFFRLRSDERAMEHIGRPRATVEQDASDLIARITTDRHANEGITWAMTLHDNDMLIGTIGFYRLKLEHHTAEVGYMMDPAHWGAGLMSEALQAVVESGFGRYGFHRIEAITDPANAASRALLLKNGFALEGIQKENFLWNGKFLDSCLYARLQGA